MRFLRIFSLLVLPALCTSCTATADEGGKIPLTTTSEMAKDHYLKGQSFLDGVRRTDAHAEFGKAIEADPEFAMAHLNHALTSSNSNVFFESLGKAVALSEKASEAERLWILGQEAGVNGDRVKQEEYWKELTQKYPKDERGQHLLGGYYFGQQQWQQAITYYEKALKVNEEFSVPYNQLGYAYRYLEQYDKAESTFRKYISVVPDDPNPYDSYAELLLKIGRYDDSIRNYRKALEQDPTFVASHIGIATNYNYKGQYGEARQQLEKMHQSAQNDGQRRAAHFAKAVSYVFERNVEAALNEYQKAYDLAAKINDGSSMAGDLGTMGSILSEFGRGEEALQYFERSFKTTMDSEEVPANVKDLVQTFYLSNLAQAAIQRGDLKTAKEKAKLHSERANALQNRFQIWLSHEIAGRIALSERRFDDALAELKQSNQQNTYNLYRIGLAYEGKGDRKSADEWKKRALNFNPLNDLNQALTFVRASKEMSAK